jgi:hypothetical protein
MSFDSMERSTYGGQPYELYRFVMGTTVWCYTSSQTIKTFQGEYYLPETISHTAVEQNTDVFSGQIEVTLPLQHVVAKGFINSAPPAPMWLTIWKNHEGLGAEEAQIVRKGRVLKATHEQQVSWWFGPPCRRRAPRAQLRSIRAHATGTSTRRRAARP